MKRTPIAVCPEAFPVQFHPFLNGTVYDSSCSQEARVWYLEQADCYLKRAPKGSLQKEAALTRYFHAKGLAAQVLAYESLEQDWLLTAAIRGEDCTHRQYLDDPKRLCETTANLLRQLHETDLRGCPVTDHVAFLLEKSEEGRRIGRFDGDFFPDAAEAWQLVQSNAKYLKNDTLLHGDYCLPNVMLDNWKFSAFIDLDTGGVGDRHWDVFWGVWTLQFNLHTDAYRDRFLDAYGRDKVEEDALRIMAAAAALG